MSVLNMNLFFRALKGGGVAIALSAATLLGGCFGPGMEERPVSELVEILQGEEESDAISAASALRQKGDPAAIDPLIDAATNSEFASVRKQSTMALQWFDNPKAIAALLVLSEDGDGDVAAAAQQGFRFVVGQSYQAIGAGMAAAKEDNPDAYETAFSILTGMIESPEEFAANSAIAALGQTGDPRAGELLVKKMDTATDFQKGTLITALGKIDSPESVAALKAAATDDNSVVAKAASTALRSLGYVDLDLLKAELETLGTQAGAIATLGQMDTPESLQLLKAQLETPSGDRKQVIQALGNRSEVEAMEALF
ncbi:MAG: HEAT repeat domain-containing protein, partial [Cyanobacteria bacterium P01_H01_bin.130]